METGNNYLPSVVTKHVGMRFPALLHAIRACFAISIGSFDSPEPLLIGRRHIDCGSVKKVKACSLDPMFTPYPTSCVQDIESYIFPIDFNGPTITIFCGENGMKT